MKRTASDGTENRWVAEKREVAAAAREIASLGLVSGSSGNVSLKLETRDSSDWLIAVTPFGMPCAALEDDDIVVVDHDGEPMEDDQVPSSETLLHIAVYRARPDVAAVVHTHSVFATVAAVAGLQIPPIVDEMTIVLGGTVRVSEYAFPSTQELADNVTAALGDRAAALIRNHGAVGVGRTAHEALSVCTLLERAAQIFVHASLLGKASPLPPEAIEAELAIYKMRRQSAGGSGSAPSV